MGMYGREKKGPRFGTDSSTGPGLTKQAFADEVNINKIIAGYAKTGMINHLNAKAPFYGDVSSIADYQESLNVVNEANALFMGMDAKVRERFSNDPVKMIEFLQDASNLEEAVKLGMVVKRPETGSTAPIDPPVVVDDYLGDNLVLKDVKRSDVKHNKGGSTTVKDSKKSDASWF